MISLVILAIIGWFWAAIMSYTLYRVTSNIIKNPPRPDLEDEKWVRYDTVTYRHGDKLPGLNVLVDAKGWAASDDLELAEAMLSVKPSDAQCRPKLKVVR